MAIELNSEAAQIGIGVFANLTEKGWTPQEINDAVTRVLDNAGEPAGNGHE